MPRRTIAPVLEYVVRRLEAESHTEAKGARRELRALLSENRKLRAVARAARMLKPQNCWGYDLRSKRCHCELHCAIERLESDRKDRP